MEAPRWMIELDRQLRRGKHVLLYGNVDDRFRKEEDEKKSQMNKSESPQKPEMILLDEYLDQYFFLRGYHGVIHFNIAEMGTVCKNPDLKDSELPKLKASKTPESSLSCIEEICNILTRQDHSMAMMESSNQKEQLPIAAIFEFTDRLAPVQQQREKERQMLVKLRKTLNLTKPLSDKILKVNSGDLPEQELKGRQNAMIFVASSLEAIPSWFYQHPALALVQIPRPDKEERRKIFKHFFKPGLKEKNSRKIEDSFLVNTEGMLISDLLAILQTAESEPERSAHSHQEIKDLIFYYRYGDVKDPWESFNRDKIETAAEEIKKRVIGQDEAVNCIVKMLKLANVGISMSPQSKAGGKPKGVFFFVGPTGVGKTELAKALAQLIFGSEDRMRRFDMSEYAQSHAAEKLTGAPPGYVGYEEGGQLTNYVRDNPFSILLFDEIEKADGKVMDKFLQILEDGRLTDGKGLTVNFSQTVIIFTSNIGSNSQSENDKSPASPQMDRIPDKELTYDFIRKHYLQKVENYFVNDLKRPEIYNRLGNNILVFDLLRPEYVRGIFAKFMRNLEASANAHHCKLVYETSNGSETDTPEESTLCEWIEEEMKDHSNLRYGGRRIRVEMEVKIEQPLAEWIFDNKFPENVKLQLGIQNKELNGIRYKELKVTQIE
ncbi:MAG: ATP-dependent Clp protease ATP-binding subunit [Thermoguttaceae bacterium]|nr:ATP-dependent Clp protease ATP-binding subunit [Thermoguttaceae bacterium]